MRIEFTVPAVPVAQPRQKQRVMMVRGRAMASNYTPAKHPVTQFKSDVKTFARQAWSQAPLTGPVGVYLTFVFPRPKGLVFKKRPMPRLRKVSKPDSDNLEKAVWDSLSGICFVDDAQVSDNYTRKRVASGSESPHVVVVIEELDAETQEEPPF